MWYARLHITGELTRQAASAVIRCPQSTHPIWCRSKIPCCKVERKMQVVGEGIDLVSFGANPKRAASLKKAKLRVVKFLSFFNVRPNIAILLLLQIWVGEAPFSRRLDVGRKTNISSCICCSWIFDLKEAARNGRYTSFCVLFWSYKNSILCCLRT